MKNFLPSLRRFHGWLRRCRHMVSLWYYLTFPLGKKAYILGTPVHSNLGDSAIVLAQKAFLQKNGLHSSRIKELTMTEFERHGGFILHHIPRSSLVTQLGGGNMGNQWMMEELFHRQVTAMLADQPMVIFPQTIHYTPDPRGDEAARDSVCVYNGRKNLTITARETVSYERMRQLYPDTRVILTPDVVLSANMQTFGAVPTQRNGILLCMRGDAERAMTDETRMSIEALLTNQQLIFQYTDMHANTPITKKNRAACVRSKMEEFAAARLVITDRLHGMVFAALTGTPCIVFSNYNHKVRGTYEWIQYLPYIRYAETVADVEKHLPELLAMEHCRYDNAPLQPYYAQLEKVVKGNAYN